MAVSASTLSFGSSNGKTKRSHIKKASNSSVDETLFGPPARLAMMTGNRSWTDTTAEESTGKRRNKKDDVIEVITKDLVRNLKVPSTPDPSGMSVILQHNEYHRLKTKAKVLTTADVKSKEGQAKQLKEQRMDDSNNRKKLMQKLEEERRRNEKPSELEEEAAINDNHITARAKELLDEQEDEIKKLNELILNAKCHAIRDTQLDEKKEISISEKEEEARLDEMMEAERLKAIEEQERKEREKKIQRLRGAKVIHQQIEEREVQRVLDKERKDQETQQMLEYMERLQQEDWENLVKKKEAQMSLMEEVTKCNHEIETQKTRLREQEKMEDLKIMGYLKDKQAREEALAKELEKQKIEKELEVARLRAQQEKAKDKQAERDALRAKRNQEQFEREWRRKEREEAQKKADTERNLCDAREAQVRNKEHFLAVQAQRERTEFERVLKRQQEMMLQDEKQKQEMEGRRRRHASDVRKQIHEKEEDIKKERKDFFLEGVKLDNEAKERRHRLDEVKQRKLTELKEAGIPDKYCAEISRKITAPPTSFVK